MADFSTRNQGFEDESPYSEQVVKVYRCATVVKGGRRFSFAALVVVGNRTGQVGWGYGKANEVPPAVEKAMKEARKSVQTVSLAGSTLHHEVIGRFGATRVKLIPASPGTGVIAGSAVRAVLELVGVQDVLTKVYGSTSAKNVVKATFDALNNLYSRESIAKLRGVPVGV